jgi:hypothetical protein
MFLTLEFNVFAEERDPSISVGFDAHAYIYADKINGRIDMRARGKSKS